MCKPGARPSPCRIEPDHDGPGWFIANPSVDSSFNRTQDSFAKPVGKPKIEPDESSVQESEKEPDESIEWDGE